MKEKLLTTAVVLICYNQEDYILAALEGIRSQTLKPDEVIIADDNSTDNTQNIISKYVRDHGLETHWSLIFNDTNLGINRNLQGGIDSTTAEIIIPMSGDDISLPNRCEVAVSLFLQHPDLHIVSTSITKIDEAGENVGELAYVDELINDVRKVIIGGMPNVFPVGQSWRRSVFSKFGKLPFDIPNEDDQITFRGILDQGIFCSSVKTVKYRVHGSSASSWLRNNQHDEEYFARFIQDMLVRKKHMEYWLQTIPMTHRSDVDNLLHLTNLKIKIYDLLYRLNKISFQARLSFFLEHREALGLRESYYLILGKFGVLSWRRVKRLLGR